MATQPLTPARFKCTADERRWCTACKKRLQHLKLYLGTTLLAWLLLAAAALALTVLAPDAQVLALIATAAALAVLARARRLFLKVRHLEVLMSCVEADLSWRDQVPWYESP